MHVVAGSKTRTLDKVF